MPCVIVNPYSTLSPGFTQRIREVVNSIGADGIPKGLALVSVEPPHDEKPIQTTVGTGEEAYPVTPALQLDVLHALPFAQLPSPQREAGHLWVAAAKTAFPAET